jgi:hypothetical protein
LTGTDWVANYDGPANALTWTATPNYNGAGSQGTLQITYTFAGLAPFVIDFQQTVVHKDGKVGSGPFRLNLNETLTNGGPTAWTSFSELIMDKDPSTPPDSGSNFHPTASHFHPSNDFANDYSPLKYQNFANPTYYLALGGGNVAANNGKLTINNLFTHDVEFMSDTDGKDLKREFIIAMGPNLPEPSSLTLTGIGMFGLAGVVWRRRQTALQRLA